MMMMTMMMIFAIACHLRDGHRLWPNPIRGWTRPTYNSGSCD